MTSSFTVGLARELYDRFAMGGWEPQDSYGLIDSIIAARLRDALDEAARVVEQWSLPTIQAPSMWLIDKAGIAAEIRRLGNAP